MVQNVEGLKSNANEAESLVQGIVVVDLLRHEGHIEELAPSAVMESSELYIHDFTPLLTNPAVALPHRR